MRILRVPTKKRMSVNKITFSLLCFFLADKKIDVNAIKGLFDAIITIIFAHTVVSVTNRKKI